MTKVIHLSSAHPAFDSRIFVKQCRSLAKANYDVSLIVQHDDDAIIDGIKLLHIKKNKSKRLKRMLFSTWQIYKLAREKKAALYHFHDAELMFAAILLRFFGAKVIYDVHEDLPQQIQSKHYLPFIFKYPLALFAKIAEWFSSLFFSGIIAATPDIANRFPTKKTIVVQNFPRFEEITNSNNSIPYQNRKNNICYIGGISKQRGIFEIVKSMNLIIEKNAKLIIAGSFFSNLTKQEIVKNKGWEKVEYLGFLDRTQIIKELNKARCGLVILHPTKAYLTSYPVKMFEYMAAGLPIIVSDFPLWREILEPYNCAIFVNPNKEEEISKAIDWILQNPKKAMEMGQRGKKATIKNYNWKSEEKKLLDFYKKILA